MENKTEKQESNTSLQDYLSLGYLYLLILGILHEMIFYGFLDINILSYSSVIDILLSPLAFLGGNPKLVGYLIVFWFVLYFLLPYLNKWNKAYALKKGSEQVEFTGLTGLLFLYAVMLFGFFIGAAIGAGPQTNNQIKNGDFKLTHQLTFSDNSKTLVRKIGNNSQYIFYVEKNTTKILISPIAGNIKKIEKYRDLEYEKKKESPKKK